MEYRIKKENDSLTIKQIIKENGLEKEIDFNYIKYLDCYLSQKELVEFVFSDDVDEEVQAKIIKMDSEIKKIIMDSLKVQNEAKNQNDIDN